MLMLYYKHNATFMVCKQSASVHLPSLACFCSKTASATLFGRESECAYLETRRQRSDRYRK